MSIVVVPYEETHIPAVQAFNQRLRRGGVEFQFPENNPKIIGDHSPIFSRDCYIAIDKGGTVRGGYILKTHPYQGFGEDNIAGNYQLPLSEGIIDPAHGMVGVQILLDCLSRQPRLYCLGMGGIARPLPVLLKKMGWTLELVPFFFRIVHPQAFLREIAFLRQRPKFRAALDLLRWTGLGYTGLKAWTYMNAIPRNARILSKRTRSRQVADFGDWADTIWKAASPTYEFIGLRNSHALSALYPAGDTRFIRLVVEDAGGPFAWAVIMATQMKRHKQFGDMKVGSLVDALAVPGRETDVVDHAVKKLEQIGVDLIVSNQSSSAWQRALQRAGFFRGPSNFAVACSKQLASEIRSLDACHFTRGDGDGPIHL